MGVHEETKNSSAILNNNVLTVKENHWWYFLLSTIPFKKASLLSKNPCLSQACSPSMALVTLKE